MKEGTGFLVQRMTPEQREEFEERAAIMEYEANQTRDAAEYNAAIATLNIKLPSKERQWDTKER
jgi:hypothetical protein